MLAIGDRVWWDGQGGKTGYTVPAADPQAVTIADIKRANGVDVYFFRFVCRGQALPAPPDGRAFAYAVRGEHLSPIDI